MILSLQMAGPEFSAGTCQSILTETVSLVHPEGLSAMVAFGSLEGVRDMAGECKSLRTEISGFVEAVHPDFKMYAVLTNLAEFVQKVGEVSERLVEIGEKGSLDPQTRVDAFNFFHVFDSVAESGLVDQLAEVVDIWEKVATNALLEQQPNLEAPPGFENDSRFLAMLDAKRKQHEERSAVIVPMARYTMSQVEALRALHRVYVALL